MNASAAAAAAAAAPTTAAAAPYTGCAHYKRKCQLLAACCGEWFPCRFCHDEEKNEKGPMKTRHTMDRKAVQRVRCMACGLEQAPVGTCGGCGVVLGAYFCEPCRLYDDVDKGQFHCDGCGICRVGGRDKYFHCDRCGTCLALSARDHVCVEKSLHMDCPICMQFLHTSREPANFLRCGHAMHSSCMREFLKDGNARCPLCSRSVADRSAEWRRMDLECALTTMPDEYAFTWVRVLCNDCNRESDTLFHVLGLKCRAAPDCGGYNTRKIDVAKDPHEDTPEARAVEEERVAAIVTAAFSGVGPFAAIAAMMGIAAPDGGGDGLIIVDDEGSEGSEGSDDDDDDDDDEGEGSDGDDDDDGENEGGSSSSSSSSEDGGDAPPPPPAADGAGTAAEGGAQ